MAANRSSDYSYTQKVWIAASILALLTILIFLIRATFSVLLLLLAGALIAVYFRSLAAVICKYTKWKAGNCLAISIIGSLLILFMIFWLIGSKLQTQITALSDSLPGTIENAKFYLQESGMGKKLVDKLNSPETQKNMETLAGSLFKSTFGILGDIYVIIFIGIFFTVSPSSYKGGIVQLVPTKHQAEANSVFNQLAKNLGKWLKGQLLAMLVVMVLTSIGLAIIGVPMWLALGFIAGLLNFIPNFGPLIAMVPAVLIGLMDSSTTAFVVAGLYIFVQVLESNFITPMVQQKLVSIPPAMIIIAQLLIAPLTGVWGLVLATPLLVVVVVLVKELYIAKRDDG